MRSRRKLRRRRSACRRKISAAPTAPSSRRRSRNSREIEMHAEPRSRGAFLPRAKRGGGGPRGGGGGRNRDGQSIAPAGASHHFPLSAVAARGRKTVLRQFRASASPRANSFTAWWGAR